MTDWNRHILDTDAEITELLSRIHTVAVLGIKPQESKAPAYYVPEHAQHIGLRIFPVPVYYPNHTEILGERTHSSLSAIEDSIDLVNVFRRPEDIPQHVDDILAAKPSAVWFQLGIRNDTVAEILASHGIDVVQDRCLMVELQERGR